MMKNKKAGVILITAMAILSLAACGVKEKADSDTQESGSVISAENLKSTESMENSGSSTSQDFPQTTDEMEETSVMAELPEKRPMTSVSGDIQEFAEKIQAAVAAEDMETLANMNYYPLFVSFGEGWG